MTKHCLILSRFQKYLRKVYNTNILFRCKLIFILLTGKITIYRTFFSGAAHTDEMDNLFRRKLFESWGLPPLQKGTDPHRLMEQMIEMWVNFATTGYVEDRNFF